MERDFTFDEEAKSRLLGMAGGNRDWFNQAVKFAEAAAASRGQTAITEIDVYEPLIGVVESNGLEPKTYM